MPQIHRIERHVPLPGLSASPKQQQHSLSRSQQRRFRLFLTPLRLPNSRRVLRVRIDHRQILHVEEALALEEVEDRRQRGVVRPDQNEAFRDERAGQVDRAKTKHVKIRRNIEENHLNEREKLGKR